MHRSLARLHSIEDLRAMARRRLPQPIFDYMDGGAEDELTLRRNSQAFDEIQLLPRCLVDVSCVDTKTTLLGREISFPLICAPTGASRLYHPAGECAVARAAAEAGVFYSLSTMATTSLEALAQAAKGPRMFQLYAFKDKGLTRDLIARCKAAGYDALCLTVDSAARGKRERELKSGMGVPMKLSPASLFQLALKPGWLAGQARSGKLSIANIAAYAGTDDLTAQTTFIGRQLASALSWDEVGEIIEAWKGHFAIKGVLAPQDARRAAEAGANAIFISNHGGRQLDGAPAPLDVLPAIADMVGERVDLILDGGVRRGSHILKALARGARACSVGRPYLYGLAAAGEAGAAKALSILRDEFMLAMQLTGCPSLAAVSADLLFEKGGD